LPEVKLIVNSVLFTFVTVVVRFVFVAVTSFVAVVVTAEVGLVACGSCLYMLSRPKLEIIFSDGVIGNITKNVSITAVSAMKQPHDTRVILVDFFRLLKKPFPLLMKKTLSCT
jgi:hypothetical protein